MTSALDTDAPVPVQLVVVYPVCLMVALEFVMSVQEHFHPCDAVGSAITGLQVPEPAPKLPAVAPPAMPVTVPQPDDTEKADPLDIKALADESPLVT